MGRSNAVGMKRRRSTSSNLAMARAYGSYMIGKIRSSDKNPSSDAQEHALAGFHLYGCGVTLASGGGLRRRFTNRSAREGLSARFSAERTNPRAGIDIHAVGLPRDARQNNRRDRLLVITPVATCE